MLATLGDLPPPAEDDRWAYEMKWDGVRAICYVEGGEIRLVSRNDKDITVAYPELTPLADEIAGDRSVLDGEIVAFDQDGRPSFERLQPRMHQRQPARIQRLSREVPVSYLLFDLLELDGEPLIDRPYEERREVLLGLELAGDRWATPPHGRGDGAYHLRKSQELGLEGVVAKRLGSPYRPGRRVTFWTKVKNIRAQEVVIAGWKPGSGRRSDMIGSLVLAVPEGDHLEYVGNVGTGFTERILHDLAEELAPLAREESPFPRWLPEFRDVRWVEPVLVGEVVYAERTRENRLRHPSWRGLRPDKSPREVDWE
ncbi:MAG TPA: non-homologous end-joining DNA ligase [Actinopolymorphaceae bacterium]